MSKSACLRQLLHSGKTLVMPDAYDPVTARIIQSLGYEAVQCSGFSMALAARCPSEAQFGLEANLALTGAICAAVEVPVMADAEDGFADADGIGETVRAYLGAGTAGMNIEDQVLSGVPGPKQLVPREVAADKIRAARAAAVAAGDSDYILNARTDALAAPTGGLEEAIARGNLYLEAGADLVFVTAVTSLEQVRALVEGLDGPLSLAAGMPSNLTAFSLSQLAELGVARVSLPSLAIFATLRAVWEVFESVRDTGGFEQIAQRGLLWSLEDLGKLGG